MDFQKYNNYLLEFYLSDATSLLIGVSICSIWSGSTLFNENKDYPVQTNDKTIEKNNNK